MLQTAFPIVLSKKMILTNFYKKIFEVTILLEKITEKKRALCYIHLLTLYVGFAVRVADKLRC